MVLAKSQTVKREEKGSKHAVIEYMLHCCLTLLDCRQEQYYHDKRELEN